MHRLSCQLGSKMLILESGKLARQAQGSILVTYGETQVLATVCTSRDLKEGINFIPLTVEFCEKFYAAGKIPGSFHKREGRPSSEATLSARLIDRPIRPLIAEGYYYETQVVITVLSLDHEADLDVAASIGASAALHISEVPFNGPTAASRVGYINGNFVLNPSWETLQSESCALDLFVVGTDSAIMMVEGGAKELSEELVLEAIMLGHKELRTVVDLINALRTLCGKPKREVVSLALDPAAQATMQAKYESLVTNALKVKEKQERQVALKKLEDEAILDIACDPKLLEKLAEPVLKKLVKNAFENLVYNSMRNAILNTSLRVDGRSTDMIRPISAEVGLLKRSHGSALFTRGETQVLSVVTLGTSEDEQIIDTMYQKNTRKFMLHYNFAPFSVGEAGRMMGQSRREIGHGALAERSIGAMLPKFDAFPYTIRIVCETLESNGSSSMASVCSASMALMNAGIPFVKPVAGIAMGLIKGDQGVAILSDILGDEDFLGDMDFKVAGTDQGITGIQMDIKIDGVSESIIRKALSQARQGRLHILSEMSKSIDKPFQEMSQFAPRIISITVPVDKIRDVIGSGGKVIKDIIAQTGCKIDIQDDGTIKIASISSTAGEKAISMIEALTAEIELNKIYKGVVKKIVEFGAFVGISPNQDGLLHISEIAHERVKRVEDYLKEGDSLDVKVIEIDRSGKVRLSHKVLLTKDTDAVSEQSKGIRTRRE